jgi:hypothetical protein
MTVPGPRGGVPAQTHAIPITHEMVWPLSEARPWTMFLAIYGFVAVLSAVAGLVIALLDEQRRSEAPIRLVLTVISFLWSWLLFQFSLAVGRIHPGRGVFQIEEALAHQHRLWRFVGIASVVYLALLFLTVAVHILANYRDSQRVEEGPPPSYEEIGTACASAGPGPSSLCFAQARVDRHGGLRGWSGWLTTSAPEARISLEAGVSDQVRILVDQAPEWQWTIEMGPAWGLALLPGEYTGTFNTQTHMANVTESVRLGSPHLWVETPPAAFAHWDNKKERLPNPKWSGSCATSPGRFHLQEIRRTPLGVVEGLTADFESSCTNGTGTWVLLGRVRVEAGAAAAAPGGRP